MSFRQTDLGPNPGDTAPLIHKGETIGMAVRTKLRTNPLIISVGHRISLETAVSLVLRSGKWASNAHLPGVRGYRLPEPTRAAHQLAAGTSRLHPEPESAQAAKSHDEMTLF